MSSVDQCSKRYSGSISSFAKYPDEIEKLQHAGVNRAFYLYAEAGVEFAESSKKLLEEFNLSREGG